MPEWRFGNGLGVVVVDPPLSAGATWRPAALVGVLGLDRPITLVASRSGSTRHRRGKHPRGSWHHIVGLIKHTEMSQSAYLVLLKPWGALTATDELWLRLPSVVVAALAAALLVVLGTRLFDRTTGIVAGVFLATNELVLQWSQEVRAYALVTFAVVLATLLFVRALDHPSRLNWLLYALVAAFAVYCHFWAGFV